MRHISHRAPTRGNEQQRRRNDPENRAPGMSDGAMRRAVGAERKNKADAGGNSDQPNAGIRLCRFRERVSRHFSLSVRASQGLADDLLRFGRDAGSQQIAYPHETNADEQLEFRRMRH
mgnify:CR=1 FL=1